VVGPSRTFVSTKDVAGCGAGVGTGVGERGSGRGEGRVSCVSTSINDS
jgi:hypothetical protein